MEKLVVQPKIPKLSDRITDYFQKTDPIRATLISGTTLLIVLIIALPCAVRRCCPQVIQLCGPITYLRKQYSKRKLRKTLKSDAKQLAYAKSVKEQLTPDPVSPSAPALEDLDARVRLLQKHAFS